MRGDQNYIPPQGLGRSWRGINPPQGSQAVEVPGAGAGQPTLFRLDSGKFDIDKLG